MNGIAWSIVYTTNIRRSDGSQTIGMTDGRDHVVYLDRALRGALHERVLAHEMVHVFMFSYGIEIDLDLEEYIADFFSVYGRDMVYVLDGLLRGMAAAK